MRVVFLTVFAFSFPGLALAEDSWPRFRGPRGNGQAEAQGLPTTWSEQENIVWKTPIHDKGWSSPVVWGKQVWLTTGKEDGTRLYALALDRDSGKILHDIEVFQVDKPAYCHPFNSYASPTPVVEEGRVYVHYGTYGTACLDTATGRILWERRDLTCNHHRGPGSSPLLYDGLLIFPVDGFDRQFVVALDAKSGRTVWQKTRAIAYGTDNGDLRKAFGTPTLMEVEGRPQLISSGAIATVAYHPKTGEELWTTYHGGMNSAIPPLFDAQRILLSSGDGGLGLLAVRPGGRGDITKTHIEWSFKKGVPSRCGPLLLGNRLVMINEAGIVTCLDVTTGKTVWQERLAGSFSASPVVAHGQVYFFSEGGSGYVAEVNPQWKLRATNKLAAGCMASPAVVGKALLVRTKTHLYRIEATESKAIP